MSGKINAYLKGERGDYVNVNVVNEGEFTSANQFLEAKRESSLKTADRNQKRIQELKHTWVCEIATEADYPSGVGEIVSLTAQSLRSIEQAAEADEVLTNVHAGKVTINTAAELMNVRKLIKDDIDQKLADPTSGYGSIINSLVKLVMPPVYPENFRSWSLGAQDQYERRYKLGAYARRSESSTVNKGGGGLFGWLFSGK